MFWAAVGLALHIYVVLVLARIVIETTRQFARRWRPAGTAALGIEAVYLSTDPPVHLLRRLIPPLRLGGISLDLSIMVLIIILLILQSLAVDFARA